MTARSLMADLANTEKGNALYDGYQQSDLDAYYEENADALDTIEHSYLYFAIPAVNDKDADGNALPDEELNKLKQEAKDGAKDKAEAALEAVKGGSSFQSQIDKYELATAADHAKTVGTGNVNATFRDQLLQLDEDVCELVDTENGYYVISFHGRYLADEPTRALDSRASDNLLELFGEINRGGQTIVMVTHSVKAASHAGRVLFLRDGQVYHQLYRGGQSAEAQFAKISDTLTVLTQGGEPRA